MRKSCGGGTQFRIIFASKFYLAVPPTDYKLQSPTPPSGMAVLGRKGRDGGTFSSAPCANAGVPAGRFDMFRRLLPATLKAARMASGVVSLSRPKS